MTGGVDKPQERNEELIAVARLNDGEGTWDGQPIQFALADALVAAEVREKQLREALDALLARHVDLVASGDCGYWDVETEPGVIAARAALAAGGENPADSKERT